MENIKLKIHTENFSNVLDFLSENLNPEDYTYTNIAHRSPKMYHYGTNETYINFNDLSEEKYRKVRDFIMLYKLNN